MALCWTQVKGPRLGTHAGAQSERRGGGGPVLGAILSGAATALMPPAHGPNMRRRRRSPCAEVLCTQLRQLGFVEKRPAASPPLLHSHDPPLSSSLKLPVTSRIHFGPHAQR